jgi:hypothetical protein
VRVDDVSIEARRTLDAVVTAVTRRGLTVPAIFILELHKPLVGMGRLAVEAFDPLLRFVLGSERSSAMLELLQSRAHIEYVVRELERIARGECNGA